MTLITNPSAHLVDSPGHDSAEMANIGRVRLSLRTAVAEKTAEMGSLVTSSGETTAEAGVLHGCGANGGRRTTVNRGLQRATHDGARKC
jgi:hypothetical protein